MKINPTKLTWQAPTTNQDGSPIDYELDYEIGFISDGVADPVPYFVVPSSLQPVEGTYELMLDELGLGQGTYMLVMRANHRENLKRVSQWSSPVAFEFTTEIPSAPLNVAVS